MRNLCWFGSTLENQAFYASLSKGVCLDLDLTGFGKKISFPLIITLFVHKISIIIVNQPPILVCRLICQGQDDEFLHLPNLNFQILPPLFTFYFSFEFQMVGE